MPALITTSRKPSSRTRTLCKDLERLIPGSRYENRGKKPIEELAEMARKLGLPRIVVITDYHGNPGGITALEVNESGWEWMPLQFRIAGVKLAREFSKQRMRRASALQADDGIGIADLFGIASEESETALSADSSRITFLFRGEEMGPCLRLRGPKK